MISKENPAPAGTARNYPMTQFVELERRSVETIERHLAAYPKAMHMWRLMTIDREVKASWEMADFIATQKLGMNDHGETHAMVAAASALTMLALLEEGTVKTDFVAAGFGDPDDSALIVLAAALCHDFGNQIHRDDHVDTGIALVLPILDRLLSQIYPDAGQRTRIRAGVLQAMYSHHGEPKPITIEAALVCIADATDMTKGRGRAAFDRGSISIHSVSALSIERVEIRKGAEKPIEIRISMANSAGIFQVQEILAPKVLAGPLAPHVDVAAVTEPGGGEYERRIVRGIRMENGKFVPCGNEGLQEKPD